MELDGRGFSTSLTWITSDTRSLGSSFRAAWAMCRGAARSDPTATIVWNYSPFAYAVRGIPLPGVLFGIVARARGCRVITIAHELIASPRSGGFRRRLVCRTQAAALHLVLAGSTCVVVTTEQRQRWLQAGGRRTRRVEYIPVFSTIDADDASPPRAADRFIVGVPAYTAEGVDPDVIIGGIASLGAAAELVLVGAPGADTTEGERWKQLCGAAGVSVSFTGIVPSAELSQAFSAVDVVLFPGVEGPTSGRTTIAAALAHGRPMVAFRGPSAWTALVDSGAVEMAEPDASSLGDTLRGLLLDPERRLRIGETGRDFYARRMSVTSASSKLGAIVSSMGPNRPSRVAIVVNRPGIQERRATALRDKLATAFDVRVAISPSPAEALSVTAWADALYVIDPGKGAFPTAVLGRLRRRPVVVEVGDPQAALYRVQGRALPSMAAGKLIDTLVARRASGVVVRGRGLAESLSVRVPWREIPDGVDLDSFTWVPADDLRLSLGLPADALVVGLVGSLQLAGTPPMSYGWDIVEALGALRHRPIWALLVGDGSGLAELVARATELGVADRLVLPGRVSHKDVPRFISAMDVCVSTQSNDEIGRGRTTAKLPEYLACDRYVLATDVGGASDVLPPEMLLPYAGARDLAHPGRLAERLEALVPRQAELRTSGGTRGIAEARYSYPVLADRLISFLHELGIR